MPGHDRLVFDAELSRQRHAYRVRIGAHADVVAVLEVRIADVADAVTVGVALVGVGHQRAVVSSIEHTVVVIVRIASITLRITVRIELVRIRYRRAVIGSIWNAVAIGIRDSRIDNHLVNQPSTVISPKTEPSRSRLRRRRNVYRDRSPTCVTAARVVGNRVPASAAVGAVLQKQVRFRRTAVATASVQDKGDRPAQRNIQVVSRGVADSVILIEPQRVAVIHGEPATAGANSCIDPCRPLRAVHRRVEVVTHANHSGGHEHAG